MRDAVKLEKFLATMEKHLEAKNIEHRLEELDKCKTTDGFADDRYITLYEEIAADVDAAMQAGINASKKVNVGYARSPALT
jgi:hypothetical protein